jgi:hypothetical protein
MALAGKIDAHMIGYGLMSGLDHLEAQYRLLEKGLIPKGSVDVRKVPPPDGIGAVQPRKPEKRVGTVDKTPVFVQKKDGVRAVFKQKPEVLLLILILSHLLFLFCNLGPFRMF